MTDPARLATRRAPHGMVASPDHLASEAGVAMLRAGGSAVDAAVAASAVLGVTAPHLCGPGGDLWALVHEGPDETALVHEGPDETALVHEGPDGPAALNASGRAGSGADADRLRAEGATEMPFGGDVRSVPVPGCVDGWLALHSRFGRLSFGEVLAPAIDLARGGFPASPLLALLMPSLHATVMGADDLVCADGLRSGGRIRRPQLAATLDAVAGGGRDAFYGGPFGRGLVELGGGEYTVADLDRPLADWVPPLGLDVWGHRLWTVPPNSQGYLTLAGAWIAERLPLPDDPDDPRWAHLLVEAARAAAHDRVEVLHEHADGPALLDPDRLHARVAAVRSDRRAAWHDASPQRGDTIFLGAVDADRLGVSLIQSNASGIGSGLAVAGTGVFLHNRGIGFDLRRDHPAAYGPGRRPPSTLSPALVTRADGSLHSVVGTMGGDSQPQILLQVLCRLLHHGQSPQRAVGSPRWALSKPGGRGFDTWDAGDEVAVRIEADAPAGWAPGLEERGHPIERAGALDVGCGHAQVVTVEPAPDGTSILAGGSDPRALVGGATGY